MRRGQHNIIYQKPQRAYNMYSGVDFVAVLYADPVAHNKWPTKVNP